MKKLSYKTVSVRNEDVVKNWLLVNAENQVLGRFSSKVASLIKGKHKPNYTPHINCGDNVIVINAEKIRLTGKKLKDKEYITYSGYPGGQKISTPKILLEKDPTLIVERAVKGMLPKNRLGRALRKNLFIYTGSSHPHAAQQPKEIVLNQ